jgi:AraC-like DNA-binding protein
LSLTLRGTQWIAHADREAVCHRRDLLVFDSSHPFTARTAVTGDEAEAVLVQVPRALLPFPSNTIDDLLARRMSGRRGICALTAKFLTEMVEHTGQYQLGDMFRLGAIVLDLVTSTLVHELGTEDPLEPHARRRLLRMRINAYIQQNLADPELSPTTIAAAHHISTSYLHKLFRDQALTITRLIRQYRLERCRRALANPQYASRPLHKIAASWGFTDKAHFSRIFRAAYGLPPSDYRALALSRHSDDPQHFRLPVPPMRVPAGDRLADCCF